MSVLKIVGIVFQVRWADLEERREQEKMRAIGFVVGQTDWSRMTDPTFGESALTQTKYI
jgi:YLP motif-containing protein 1